METNEVNSCLGEALFELQILQDFLGTSSTKYFGKLLYNLLGVDTIPLLLLKEDGLFYSTGVDFNEKTGKGENFETSFFRIEAIENNFLCATFSLLRPFDLFEKDSKFLSDIIRLKRTTNYVQIDLRCICGIQPLETELLKRKIIVEPKW